MNKQPLVIFQEFDVRIVACKAVEDMPVRFIVEVKSGNDWYFSGSAYHVKPALAVADGIISRAKLTV